MKPSTVYPKAYIRLKPNLGDSYDDSEGCVQVRGVGDVGLVAHSLPVGLGRVEDEFGDSSVSKEVFWTEQSLGLCRVTSLLEASEGSPLTNTRLSCRMRTFSSGTSSNFIWSTECWLRSGSIKQIEIEWGISNQTKYPCLRGLISSSTSNLY